MVLLICLATASFVLVLQADPTDAVMSRCLKELRSDSFSERERATEELKQLNDAACSLLKEALGKETDVEVRTRLLVVTKHLHSKEGERLWGEGKLREALLFELYDEDPGFLGKRDEIGMERRVVEQYGKWAVPLLLQELGKNGAGFRIPTGRLLQKMESVVVPHLCESLRTCNRHLQRNAMSVLKGMVFSYGHPKLPEALEFVISDSAADERTKETADELLQRIKALPKKTEK